MALSVSIVAAVALAFVPVHSDVDRSGRSELSMHCYLTMPMEER
jgi:hypothetical protein